MTDDAQELLPRLKRHKLRGGKTVKIKLEGRGAVPVEAEGVLLDISRTGIQLSLSVGLAIHEAVLLRLEIPELDLNLLMPAQVCWSRPHDGEQWRFGCAFSPPLPEGTLRKLAEGGFLQRRETPRQDAAIDGRVRWATAGESYHVRVIDVSQGGFNLLGYAPAQVGDRMLLEIDQADQEAIRIPARAQWQSETERGCLTGEKLYLVGCMFLDKQGYPLLRQCLPPDTSDEHSTRRAWASRWRRMAWIALPVAAAALYLLLR